MGVFCNKKNYFEFRVKSHSSIACTRNTLSKLSMKLKSHLDLICSQFYMQETHSHS